MLLDPTCYQKGMAMTRKMDRRHFNKILITAGAAALAPFNIARAQSTRLKIGVLLPKSGLQGLIG